MADSANTTNPVRTPSLIEQWLARKAKECRSFVQYAEDNADDWAGTLAWDERQKFLSDADQFQYAADVIWRLVLDRIALAESLSEYVRDFGDNEDADSKRMAAKARDALARVMEGGV